ncbi:hypothetical protein RI129_002939 [Pyrocoelia pectoralis]|uniref:DDE Tnp4 domain-containing protein n=1 Tax=Pyrocoelia pectoralis TaxID=417401 RepID=A0AAN7ZM35_9COLE
MPSTTKEWEEIAKEFYTMWNIPNTVGALDGKHIVFRAPRSAGSHYYNYKGTHSIVLLAIVNANYKFIYIDVGTNGRISDGGVFDGCDFACALEAATLHLPSDQPLPGMTEPVPHVILADAAFPLQRHILKPFPFKSMTREQRIFNYRLSRGRRVVENAFGILANRFRILLTPINLSRDKVVLITQSCCALHNFIKIEAPNIVLNEVDEELSDGNVQLGSWRNRTTLQSVNLRSGRPTNANLNIRNIFTTYFNNYGQVPWQNNMI